jgi:hypothetical protein
MNRFSGAIMGLTNASLIVRSPELEVITLDPVIQSTVFSGLPEAEMQMYLDCAIQLVSLGFPNSWIEKTHEQGHGWKSWQICSALLPHVSRLMKLVEKHSLKPTNMKLFEELIFRTGT